MTQKLKMEAMVDLDEALKDLPDVQRAVLGVLIGAASAMQTNLFGVEVRALVRDVGQAIPGVTALDIFEAIDALQDLKIKFPYEEGEMTIAPMAVLATITDKKGVVESITVAVTMWSPEVEAA